MEKFNVQLHDREFRIWKKVRKDDRGKWTISLNLRPYGVHASKSYPRYYYFNNSEISKLSINYIDHRGHVLTRKHDNISWKEAKKYIVENLIT